MQGNYVPFLESLSLQANSIDIIYHRIILEHFLTTSKQSLVQSTFTSIRKTFYCKHFCFLRKNIPNTHRQRFTDSFTCLRILEITLLPLCFVSLSCYYLHISFAIFSLCLIKTSRARLYCKRDTCIQLFCEQMNRLTYLVQPHFLPVITKVA